MPLLSGEVPRERALFWHYPHYGNQGGAPAAAIRLGEWKLIEWLEDGRVELFRLSSDPGEATNLAASEPERVLAMRYALHAWQKDVGARFPTANPAYRSDRPNGRGAKRTPDPSEARP